MAGNILVSPEELRGHATNVKGKAQQATADFDTMRAQLEALSSAFQGEAATSFQQHWDDWHRNAHGLAQALEGLGQFLQAAANAIEATDKQLASHLGQG